MKKIVCILLYFMLLVPFSSWSQKPSQDFRFVSIKEGIPKTGVYTIVQDHYGFMWIGTNGTGLYKFDGIDYTVYKHDLQDSTSLSSNRVMTSYLDKKDRLWVATENGLNTYDRSLDQFIRVVVDSTNIDNEAILSLEEDSSNNLLVGTQGLGMFKLNLETFKVQKISNSTFSEEDIPMNIKSIQHSSQGKSFVGTSIGLKEVDPVNNKLIDTRLFLNNKRSFDSPIETMFIDSEDNLWIGTQRGEGVFKCKLSNDVNSSIIDIKHLKISSKKIMTIRELPNGTIAIGTENDGLFHINSDGEVIKNYRTSNTLESNILHNSIWSVFVDHNQRIWIGYFNSGVAVSDELYDKFSDIKSLPDEENSLEIGSVMAMMKDDDNRLWIATDGGGIDLYNQNLSKIGNIPNSNNPIYKGLSTDYIKCMIKDSNGNIWLGTWGSGIFLLKKGAKKFVNFSLENTSGNLESNHIISISEDSEGTLWIGTYYSGLHSLNPKSLQIKRCKTEPFVANGLFNVNVKKVLVDSEDIIWVGTTNGLFQVIKQDDGSLSVVSLADAMIAEYKNPSNANHIHSLFESSDGNIWIGTLGAGLCKYDRSKNKFSWYNKITGLEEENIAAIIEDDQENLWLSGNAGLTKVNLSEQKFTNYNINDGLLSNDFNYGAVSKDEEGILYFGNIKGVDYFNPRKIKTNNSPPSLYLTDFKLFNEKAVPNTEKSPLKKVISETDSIALTHQQSVFTIEYSGINYTRPEKNNYAYYLQGYETDWNYVGQKRDATYTNLDPGNYTFMLKASNNDGIWNEKPLELKITILKPWWRKNWAIFSYAMLFLLGVFLLNHFTRNRIKERELIKNERLQQVQNEELHNKKIQFFTNISHEFRTPLTLILNPLKEIMGAPNLKLSSEVRSKHAIIYKNTDRLYRLINELMDLRKLELNKMNVRVEKIHIVDFAKGITKYFEEEAVRKNILLTVDSDVPDSTVWADAKMLEKIIFNLVSNAVKVTPDGGTIHVELRSTDQLHLLPLVDEKDPVNVIEIIVSDTGIGLEKDQIDKIFERFYQVKGLNKTYFGGTGIGLEVVQNFVKLHKGDIEVESKVGEGTTFKVYLPVGNDHFSEDQIMLTEKSMHAKKEDFLSVSTEQIPQQVQETEEEKQTHTILIVEDNSELRHYLKNTLGDQYKVLLANNGKEGIKVAKESFPDAIITDVIMPEMDGFEFCKTIKTDSTTSHIPLLMLTAKATIENRIEGLENGADAYMVKPFDLKLLKLRLSQLIQSRQLIFDKYFGAISGTEDQANYSSIDKEFIQKLLAYINENIGNSNLGVEDLASHLNLSRSQLYRKVKALTGKTISEFIRKIRLERAKKILESGNKNISEACYSVGFASPSYFSKCFKAYFGVLPTEVDKLSLKEGE